MKFIFIVLPAIPFSAFSQELRVIISVNNESINVSANGENKNTVFTLDSSSFTGNKLLTIYIEKDETEKDWKRSFAVYDSAGNAIKDFVFMKNRNYCIKLTEFKNLLQTQHEYFIYTMSIPEDPRKAMLVKTARQLLCVIKIL